MRQPLLYLFTPMQFLTDGFGMVSSAERCEEDNFLPRSIRSGILSFMTHTFVAFQVPFEVLILSLPLAFFSIHS